MSEYAVVFEQASDGGWSAFAPDLPGVVASADSRSEAEVRIVEAIRLYRDELASDGVEVPAPSTEVGVVSA